MEYWSDGVLHYPIPASVRSVFSPLERTGDP
jgi:hypothetical protein